MTNKRRLRVYYILSALLALSVVVGLILYALRQNIDLFYTPSELQSKEKKLMSRIRLGGMVQKGSLQYADDLSVKFIVTDFKADIAVAYSGILPDLFREGQGVVALGRLNADRTFIAEQILAKHDETYMPPRQ